MADLNAIEDSPATGIAASAGDYVPITLPFNTGKEAKWHVDSPVVEVRKGLSINKGLDYSVRLIILDLPKVEA